MADINYTRPWMYPKQQAALFHEKRFGIIEATTKCGKTAASMIWLTEHLLRGQRGHNFWWVAPVYVQSKMVWKRVRDGLPRGLYKSNASELTLDIDGRVMWFKSGDNPDSLYGEDVYACVIDEATRCKPEVWYAITTTLSATRGPVRVIGNVKGKRNWAYKLARRAQSGADNMQYAKLTADDAIAAGIMARETVNEAEAGLPESIFRQLYYAEAADDEGNPFGLEVIRECVVPALSTRPPVMWGWDIAKSKNWTVGIALDIAGHVCRFERWNRNHLPPGMPSGMQYWQATVHRIRELIGATPTLIDSTGVGDPVFEAIAQGRALCEGYKFTQASKQQLMEGLAVALQSREIHFPEGPISAELEAFEYEYRQSGVSYAAPEGMDDDCVCALALAVARWVRTARFADTEIVRILSMGRFATGSEEPDEATGIEAPDDSDSAFDDGNIF